jgi:hypothetical protein
VGGDEGGHGTYPSELDQSRAQSIDDPKHAAATTRQTSQAPITSRFPKKKAAG